MLTYYSWPELLAVLVIIGIPATWRISYMLVNEDGPRDIFISLRQHLGAFDVGNDGVPLTSLGRGIKCIYCVSVWVGFITVMLIYTIPLSLVPFALSAGALWLNRIIRRE